MCSFFSFISDGRGNLKYFNYQQRKERVAMPDSGRPPKSYDSHTSIATFYGLTGKKEDGWNKWEYNPLTESLKLDAQNTEDDRASVLESLNSVDFKALCGDIDGIKALIRSIKDIPWFSNRGKLPDGVKLFDTRDAAWDAARDAAWDAARAAAWDAAGDAAWYAARDAAWDAAWDAARAAAWDAAWYTAGDAARDAALQAGMLACDDLNLADNHTNHARSRWAVWEAGYGVACDVNGVLYCYKRT